jgi:folate-dependent phosphoribosylglycinamide formyltransferase PurN
MRHEGLHDAIRLAFVASSGGGVIDSLAHLSQTDDRLHPIGVLTDRPCGAEKVAIERGLDWARVVNSRPERWSARAAAVLRSWRPGIVLLLFLRTVGPELWRDLPRETGAAVWNLHPSLLPAYGGLGALERSWRDARAALARNHIIPLGVTLHQVTGDVDAGPIIAQRRFDPRDAPTLDHARHLTHLHKVALVLEAASRLRGGNRPVDDAIAMIAQPWARPLFHRAPEATLA